MASSAMRMETRVFLSSAESWAMSRAKVATVRASRRRRAFARRSSSSEGSDAGARRFLGGFLAGGDAASLSRCFLIADAVTVVPCSALRAVAIRS